MKNFLKGMLFSVVTVIIFIAIMLMTFDIRDKKYFKDRGTIAYEAKNYNFFYGVYGFHNLTPVYHIEDESFDFYMYDIVGYDRNKELKLVEYVYMLYIPKGEVSLDTKYLLFYNEDNTFDRIRMDKYMNFNMYNTYDENFLISKEYLVKKDYKRISFVDGETTVYLEDFVSPYDDFDNIGFIQDYYDEHNKLPGLQLTDIGIYPQTSHIADGYTYIIWIGLGAGLFVMLALFGGVYLKPPFQKPKVEPTPAMKRDQHKYTEGE